MACNLADEEVKENGLNSLQALAMEAYDVLEHYFKDICEITAAAAKSTDPRIGAQAFMFWATLAEEELSKVENGQPSKNYIASCKDQLL